jgi:UDP-2,3-diacylglucosamine hydrolase
VNIRTVPFHIASDIHLRSDRPERGRRFAQWVRTLHGNSSLLIAGDLCDFWMVARQEQRAMMASEGIAALIEFRERGGQLAALPGNHDLWLCPFYERALGAHILREPYETTVEGLRLHVVHGHLLGARRMWKSWMESREFKYAFEQLPEPLATLLDQLLERKNSIGLSADEQRHLAVYRQYAARLRGVADIVIIGHVHRAVDDSESNPRLVVLGGWQKRSSFLTIDPAGATFHVVADEHPEDRSTAVGSLPSHPSPTCPTS